MSFCSVHFGIWEVYRSIASMSFKKLHIIIIGQTFDKWYQTIFSTVMTLSMSTIITQKAFSFYIQINLYVALFHVCISYLVTIWYFVTPRIKSFFQLDVGNYCGHVPYECFTYKDGYWPIGQVQNCLLLFINFSYL